MTPFQAYQKKIKEGELRSDVAQAAAMEALDKVFHDILIMSSRRRPGSISRFLIDLGRSLSPTGIGGRNDTIKGLYMHGGVGRGKSMLMDLFFSCLPDQTNPRRVHFHEFMIEVHDYISQRSGHGYDRALPDLATDIAQESPILCFDEFHVTDIADAMILGRLFTALFDKGVVVIATSNWAPDDLYKDGLQRDLFLPFIEILKVHVDVLHLDSPTDYRGEFIAQFGTYFTPLGSVSAAQMDEIFKAATAHNQVHKELIEVKGRKIEIENAAGGVVRMSFQQLCERPHGAEDYLAIGERFHTIFLEDIPRMNYDRRNEAKRFMILIDALYEAKTKVIFSADAPPEKLYSGDDHAYEFKRTISRLNEMQSAEWVG